MDLPPLLVAIQGIVLNIWNVSAIGIDFVEDLSCILHFHFSKNANFERTVQRKN